MSASPLRHQYDVVVVGGGHNGLVAAGYLARAGLTVLVLERLRRTGGAAVTDEPFPGRPVRVSPYASLVGLLPDQLVSDLGLRLDLRPRATAAYSPTLRDGHPGGLLVEREPTAVTAASFRELTGSDREYDAWRGFHDAAATLARVVAPTLLQPLPDRADLRALVPGPVWDALVERPLGEVVEETFADDTVRGVVASGGLRGTFVDLHDPGLGQNRRFLQHSLGGGPGGWRVPVGGAGAVTEALEAAARDAGAEVVTRAYVNRLDTDGEVAEVGFRDPHGDHVVDCSWVLGGVAPWVLRLLLGVEPGPRPEGSQVGITMVLDRLPRLRSGVPAEQAFAGTVHVGAGYAALQDAFRQAARGDLPEAPPGLLTCHSLADPSVVASAALGTHTLRWSGLHLPARLFVDSPQQQLDEVVLRVLDSIDVHLEEPLRACLALDANGDPCLTASSPQNVEAALAMPGGHVHHGASTWPWSSEPTTAASPAQRWGVDTAWANVLRCSAGAVRGGGVSGIGGHNAAMAVLETCGAAPTLLHRVAG